MQLWTCKRRWIKRSTDFVSWKQRGFKGCDINLIIFVYFVNSWFQDCLPTRDMSNHFSDHIRVYMCWETCSQFLLVLRLGKAHKTLSKSAAGKRTLKCVGKIIRTGLSDSWIDTYSSLESNSGQQNLLADINLETVQSEHISDRNHIYISYNCPKFIHPVNGVLFLLGKSKLTCGQWSTIFAFSMCCSS